MPVHIHYWRLESPNGPTSKGVCECGEEQLFANADDRSLKATRWTRGTSSRLLMPPVQGGSNGGRGRPRSVPERRTVTVLRHAEPWTSGYDGVQAYTVDVLVKDAREGEGKYTLMEVFGLEDLERVTDEAASVGYGNTAVRKALKGALVRAISEELGCEPHDIRGLGRALRLTGTQLAAILA